MIDIYQCPKLKTKLTFSGETDDKGHLIDGVLTNKEGTEYRVTNSIADLSFPSVNSDLQREQLDYYESVAQTYDDVQHLTFDIQYEDESAVRNKNIDQLQLKSDAKVLDLACGTGNDSLVIAQRLAKNGQLVAADISQAMLKVAKNKLQNLEVPSLFSVVNARHLPFPDNYFDAVHSFGGLNVFEDKKRALKEMVRVTKVGGRISVGDESMPPWLYRTEFGNILLNNNKLFKIAVPLEDVPVEARDVCLRWIIGGVYFMLDFEVGEGEPKANFDLPIPGARGGTLRTRYYGKLDGVSKEAKKLALSAAKKSQLSIHDWLTKTVRDAARKELSDKKDEK